MINTKIKSSLFVLLISAFALAGCGPKGDTTFEKRTAIREMKNDTLAELYENNPEAKKLIESSAGYAVFSNKNTKIFVAGAGTGYGIAIDSKTNKETFMKVAEIAAGLGMGITDTRAVFIFQEADKFNTFLNDGWQFGGDADAVAKSEETGGAGGNLEFSLAHDPVVYEFTKNGISLSAGIAGTKYWRNDDLNEY